MRNIAFYKHNLNTDYSKYISKVLKSDFLTSGNVCKKTEKEISKFFNINYCLLTSSWTSGALATLMAMGIRKGDEVIVPAMTFVATANVIELLGATPRFVDVDRETLLIDIDKTLKLINKKTKAIMPVHLYGNMVDIRKLRNKIKSINKKIFIIEDSAHCFEGKFNNSLSGRWSDCAIFSFYATKNITCGEGGAVITNNKNLYKKISEIRVHGLTKSAIDRFIKKKYRLWNMNRLGIKANMPDILASLLSKQIKNVYKNLRLREQAYNYYNKLLDGASISRPIIDVNCKPAYHLYVIHVHPNIRNDVLSYLNKYNIGATINYPSVTNLNYYKNKYKLKNFNYNVSVEWGNGTISLPFYPNIKKKDQEYVVKKLIEAKKKYG